MAQAKNSGLSQNSVDRLIAQSKFAPKSMEMMEGDDGPPLIAEACPESVMDVENEDCRADGDSNNDTMTISCQIRRAWQHIC